MCSSFWAIRSYFDLGIRIEREGRVKRMLKYIVSLVMLITLIIAGNRVMIAQATDSIMVPVVLTQSYTDTGLQVSEGQTVSISATGDLNWCTGHCPAGQNPPASPGGMPWNQFQTACTAIGQQFVAPGLPVWSLLGKIGDGQPFEVGTQTTFQASSSSELYLGVNDCYYGDNSGSWTATVTLENDCSKMYDVDSTKMSITLDPRITAGVYADAIAGGNYLYVFTGLHVGSIAIPYATGFEWQARPGITIKPGVSANQAGNLSYIRNLLDWSGSATYGVGGDAVSEYGAVLPPGVTTPILDAGTRGNYIPVGFFPDYDSPQIHVPVLDLQRRPLSKLSYSKTFTDYAVCSLPGKNAVYHTVAAVTWHVLYYGSVDVPSFGGQYLPERANFIANAGAAVYHDPIQTMLPLPVPITSNPTANCVVGFEPLDPTQKWEGDPRCPKGQ
jgi:hypothetical protein